MDFNETLEFIHAIPRFNKDLGLEKIEALLAMMGNPQNDLKFVHVAGTNGKGSTCSMLSHILAGAGYKTGLYISPFIIEFRERIQINNQMIPHGELEQIASYVRGLWEQLKTLGEPPSEFEVVLAIALEYFKRSNCEIVVLEVGMGGRLDATNIIPRSLVSVIASISLDHTVNLGTTIEAIAKEKAGIIKPNVVTVVYPKQELEALAVVMEQCSEQNNKLVTPHNVQILSTDLHGSKIVYDDYEYFIPLIGEHQVYNTMMVLEVCKELGKQGFALSQNQIAKGLSDTTFPSRLEILRKKPLVILDGAHNIGGIESLVKALKFVEGRRIHAIMGMVKDKDADSVVAEIAPHFDSVISVWDRTNPRFFTPQELAEKLQPYCNDVSAVDSPTEAFLTSLERCGADDVILICGSLYLGAILREFIVNTSI